MGGARLRVLLVEDDEADAFLVGELLAEVSAAVDLTVVTSLAAAAERIADVDCVLLDLGLPDAQGLAGLRHLVTLREAAAICVLTGLGDEHLGTAALGEGAQDYLIKGQVDGVLLSRSLRYAVERKRAEENARRLHEVELQQQESARLERGLLPVPLLRTARVRAHPFYRSGRRATSAAQSAEQAPRTGSAGRYPAAGRNTVLSRGGVLGRNSVRLGGDFYDVVQTAPGRVSMMVGDVCGHGVEEAALGVELRVAWRALMLAGVDDEAVLPAIEQVLISERRDENVFATLATATIDLDRAEAEVRLAGHPPPLLLADGSAVVVPATYGPVLGVLDSTERPMTRIALASATWSLMLYTDGLIEGRVGDGDARLGVAGLRELINSPSAGSLSTSELGPWLVGRAEELNKGPLGDDVAVLILSSAGGASQSRAGESGAGAITA